MEFLKDIRILDVFDFILFILLIFWVYKKLRGTAAFQIFLGIAAFYLLWQVAKFLNMRLISQVMGQFMGVGVVLIVIVFQQEIRRFLLMIGTGYSSAFNDNKYVRIFREKFKTPKTVEQKNVENIATVLQKFSQSKTGALIVIENTDDATRFVTHADEINADIHPALIESIFFNKSPLHDGAMLIRKNKIIRTRGVLPLTENNHLPKKFGLRHRAALGISERCDAVAITVSEEKGSIHLFVNGKYREIDPNYTHMELNKIWKIKLQEDIEKDLHSEEV